MLAAMNPVLIFRKHGNALHRGAPQLLQAKAKEFIPLRAVDPQQNTPSSSLFHRAHPAYIRPSRSRATRREGLRPTWRSWRSWCGTRAIRPYFIAKGCCRLVKAAVETECAEFPARKNRQPSCRRQASQPFGPTIFFAGLTNNATQCGEWRTRTCDSLYYMEF
jgi:hypothetical protein